MLGRSPATVGPQRARLRTRDRITPGDLVCPKRSNQCFQRQEWGKLPRLGGSLAAAVGGFIRAPTTRAAPPHGHSENGHIHPTAH